MNLRPPGYERLSGTKTDGLGAFAALLFRKSTDIRENVPGAKKIGGDGRQAVYRKFGKKRKKVPAAREEAHAAGKSSGWRNCRISKKISDQGVSIFHRCCRERKCNALHNLCMVFCYRRKIRRGYLPGGSDMKNIARRTISMLTALCLVCSPT